MTTFFHKNWIKNYCNLRRKLNNGNMSWIIHTNQRRKCLLSSYRQCNLSANRKLQPVRTLFTATILQQNHIFEGISKCNDRFCLRLAKESDYNDVIEMSRGIYDGFDYMGTIFVEQCRDPHSRVFMVDLLKEDGDKKAIGMFAATHVPEDESLYAYAWRINNDYRGRGIGKSIKPAIYEFLKKEFDPLCYYPVRSYVPGWDSELIFSQKPSLAANWYCLHYTCDKWHTVSKALEHYNTLDVKVYDAGSISEKFKLHHEIYDFLGTNSHNNFILDGILNIPLEVKAIHVKKMVKSANVSIFRDYNGNMKGLAFGYVTEKSIDKATHLDLFYYGALGDETSMKNHVCAQITCLKDTEKNFHLLVSTVQIPFHLNSDEVILSLTDTLGDRYEIPPPYNDPSLVLAKYIFRK